MKVSLRDGTATFSLAETVILDPRAIRHAVAKLNFTPKELRIKVRGQIVPWSWPEVPQVDHSETTALEIEATGQLFLLADPPERREQAETPLKQLVALSLVQKHQIVVSGTIHQHSEDLPLGLVMESYEFAPEKSAPK